MLAQIGDIIFEGLLGFESLGRQRAAILPEHALYRGKARLQHTGSELESISVGIRLHCGFCDPEAQLAVLNGYLDKGEILPFIKGTGEYLGDYVIASIQEDTLQTDKDGAIVSVSLGITLKEHFDADKVATQTRAAINNAGAIQDGTIRPLPVLPLAQPATAESIHRDISVAKVSATDITASISTATSIPARAAFYYDKISEALQRTQEALARVTAKLGDAQDIVNSFPNLLSNVTAVQNIASTFQGSMPPTSIGSLTAVNSSFQSAVSNLNMQSAGLAGLIAARKR